MQSAAAKQLNVPLATVSRRIGELEAHLDTRLLNRCPSLLFSRKLDV
ncbi:helix-turn-helix domain-containing protein [Phyllobacterium ifriqiyense]|nr:LysR family transcriptional regulator [Phyllobacterium ifriqiyense]